MSEPRAPDGVILEFAEVGGTVRVSAMDPDTLTEVVIQGPATAGEAALRLAVLRKLDYVLRRRTTTPTLRRGLAEV